MRTFIGIFPPPALLQELTELNAELRQTIPISTIRWTNPAQLHVTLKFLGNTEPANVPNIRAAIAASAKASPPFELAVSGAGAFPGKTRPKILWLGLNGNLGVIQDLQRSLQDGLEPVGYPREERPFKPHLTFARTEKVNNRDLGSVYEKFENLALLRRFSGWKVEAIRWMESHLGPGGARYSVLEEFPLGK